MRNYLVYLSCIAISCVLLGISVVTINNGNTIVGLGLLLIGFLYAIAGESVVVKEDI